MEPLLGIGLRQPHYQRVLEERPAVGWFEVHSENFFHEGSPSRNTLTTIAKHYPMSLHGVGLSLGSAKGFSQTHIKRLKSLMNDLQPRFISEHLSWSQFGDTYLPDLLPVPYTKESLKTLCTNVIQAQEALGQTLLIENPSSYLEFEQSEFQESEFLVCLCQQTGANILLDVNNIFVSASNHGWDPQRYIDNIPVELVKEIHLSGHTLKRLGADEVIRVDTHDQKVCQEVWDLYGYASDRFGPLPTLLEWDAQIPPLEILLKEISKAPTYWKENWGHCASA